MARKSSTPARVPKVSRLWRTVIVLTLLGAAYWYQEKHLGGSQIFEQATTPPVAAPEPPARESVAEKPAPAPSAAAGRVNGYERLEGCRMVEHRNNDGDSFWVRHGDREFELRLYYADAAEKYLSDRHADQRQRVGEQARDFGGLSVEQTVELGKAAKLYTAKLLEGKTFTVHTKWERVYDGERFYGWVELPGTEGEYLNERLVEKGIARIHTKGEPSPDGASYRQYKAHLEKLEREAREAGRGAWGLD